MWKFPLILIFILSCKIPFSLAAPPPVPSNGFLGEIYRLKGDRSQPFAYQTQTKLKNEEKETVENTFTSPAGEVLAIERAEFVAEKIIRYEQDQKQLATMGVVEVKNEEVHFSFTKNGKTKTAKEKWTSEFVVGPSVVAYLQKNWSQLMNGGAVNSRLGVVDRLETVGFTFKKEKELVLNGEKVVQLKMKPSSFLISALVDPLLFSFKADGSRLVELDGRAVVKEKVGEKAKDFDAHTIYKWPTL